MGKRSSQSVRNLKHAHLNINLAGAIVQKHVVMAVVVHSNLYHLVVNLLKSKDLMRYFSPSPVDQLVVDSGNADSVDGSNGRLPARDINPTWFGIA